MGDSKITRDVYLQYAKKIVGALSDDAFYSRFRSRVDGGVSNFKLAKKRLVQDISVDWIETIEDCLPNLDTIVRNPRRFIVQEEDIVDISLAKSISTESVKHLAQHTNMISKVDKDGMVTPNRILNITKEESFEIYENRFIYTLLLKLKDFVTLRYDKIKKASATQDVLHLDVESRFNLPSKKITYRTEYLAQLSFDEVMQLEPETLSKIERVAKIDRIITDFLSSSFAKSMRGSAPVRPPITRTNVILKEPNFKKALTLWQFIETYQQTGGFSSADDVETYPLDADGTGHLKEMVALNTMLFESLYEQCETDFDMEDAEFADILRAGEMNFRPDEIERDKFGQELDEKEQDEDEKDNTEEAPPEEEEKQEEEVEVEVEQEVETEVDKEVETEAPPHEMPDDEEPDEDKFDNNLFDVRRLYKRPEDDKLKKQEIARVKDAIDRCLNAYRTIKQEEIDRKEKAYREEKRREDILRRAEEYRRQLEIVGREYSASDSFMGGNEFGDKVAVKVKQDAEDFKKRHKELFADKNEKLEPEVRDTEEIRREIELMNAERGKRYEEERRRAAENDDSERTLDAPDAAIEKRRKKKAEDTANAYEGVKADDAVKADDTAKADEGVKTEENGSARKEANENAAGEKPKRRRVKNAAAANASEAPAEEPLEVRRSEQPDGNAPEEGGKGGSREVLIYGRGLSPTTMNQKYSSVSGRKINLSPVDETKVAVGGIRIKSQYVDPWETGSLTNAAERNQADVDNGE